MNVRYLVDYSQPLVAAATVLAIGAVFSTAVAGYTAYSVKVAADTVTVTGSAKEAVRADYARWTIHLETKTGTLSQQEGVNRLESAKDRILAYLEREGFADTETPISSIYPNYTYPERAEPILTGYTVSRDIIVRSEDVDGVSALAGNIAPLTGASYTVTTGGLELTYRKLDEMRVTLLSAAIADALARAEAIAGETGRRVGALRSASSGVVQVLPEGGVEISDYGTYDTQNINKEVMVTVRADFSLR